MAIKYYGFWRSLAASRVRIALALKGVTAEEISVNLMQGEQLKPEYRAVEPAGGRAGASRRRWAGACSKIHWFQVVPKVPMVPNVLNGLNDLNILNRRFVYAKRRYTPS